MTTTKNRTLSVPATIYYDLLCGVGEEGRLYFTIPNSYHNVPHVFPKVVPNCTISFAQSPTIFTLQ
jgi:hypothetical protein